MRPSNALSTAPVGAYFYLVLVLSLVLGPEAAVAEDGRLISVGGSVTEIVYALGEEDRLIAVDSTSTYPPEAHELPNVGYLRTLSAEPILALEPSLVLAEPDAGPQTAIEQIRDAGVPVKLVSDDPTPDGVIEKITLVAAALNVSRKGEGLAARIEGEFDDLRRYLADVADGPRVLFLLSIGNGAPLAAGRETSADGIIALAGGRNAVTGYSGYKPLTPEAAVELAPDAILIDSRSLEALGGEDALLARPELAATPAGRAGRVIAMDGMFLLGFGPRTAGAARQLAAALHPDLTLADAAGE